MIKLDIIDLICLQKIKRKLPKYNYDFQKAIFAKEAPNQKQKLSSDFPSDERS